MNSDLREKLATLYLDREYDGDEDMPLAHCDPDVQAACYAAADAALAVFAAELRAAALRHEAEKWRDRGRADGGDLLYRLSMSERAQALRDFAGRISPGETPGPSTVEIEDHRPDKPESVAVPQKSSGETPEAGNE